MVCFNKAPFILRFVCPPLHGAVKPQAALFKIKKAQLKPSPSALLKRGLFSRSLHPAPSQLRQAVALRGAGTPPLRANYPALLFQLRCLLRARQPWEIPAFAGKLLMVELKTFLHRLGP